MPRSKGEGKMYDVEIVEKAEKKVVAPVLHTTFAENSQAREIQPFFHEIMEKGMLEHVPNRMGANQICAIALTPGSPEFDYYMGIEVISFDDDPPKMKTLIIPDSKFTSTAFIKRGNPDVLAVFKYLTEEWIPDNGCTFKPNVPLFISYDDRFIPSFKEHSYDGTQIAEMHIPVKCET